MKRKKLIKGVTLLEVVIVVAIIGILLVPIIEFFSTNMRLNQEANEKINAKDVALLVQEYIYNQVKWANQVEYSDTPISMEQSIYIDENKGLVHKKGTNIRCIYSKEAMNHFNVTLSFKKLKETEKTLTDMKVTVSKMKNGVLEELYSNNTSIKSINITAGSISNTTGKVINFQIPAP